MENALYKVIKLRNTDEAGDKIVVQGGTFMNDAVLRSFEKIIGKDVVRPDIVGLMGAYGCSLIAKESFKEGTRSSILSATALDDFSVEQSNGRCGGCENRYILTINKFADGSRFITGNRCEKGAGLQNKSRDLPNLYAWKFNRLFDYEPLSEFDAERGTAVDRKSVV